MKVISEKVAKAAYDASKGDPKKFAEWGDAQALTDATCPRVRGTKSHGGGLVPARYVY